MRNLLKDLPFQDVEGHLTNKSKDMLVPELMKVLARAAEDLPVVSQTDNLNTEADPGIATAAAASEQPEPVSVHAQEPRVDVSTMRASSHSINPATIEEDAARIHAAQEEAKMAPNVSEATTQAEGDEAIACWELDLWKQHGVLSPLMQQKLRGWSPQTAFYCEKCYVRITNWRDVGNHVRGKKHQQTMLNATDNAKQPEPAVEHATEPLGEATRGSWRLHWPHAQTGTGSAVSSEPSGNACSNSWVESHVFCDHRWTHTWIPAEWKTRGKDQRATAGSWENTDKSQQPKQVQTKWQ